jgi:phosphoglycolate phosphatase
MLMPESPEKLRHEAFLVSEARIVERMFEEHLLLPHAKEVLEVLAERGYALSTASNCGQSYLDAVLDSQEIRDYFTRPLCLETVHGKKKADILAEHFRTFDKADCYMVGDRSSDIEAATAHGVPAIGCAFGFGPEHELRGAVTLIRSLTELLPLFPGDD